MEVGTTTNNNLTARLPILNPGDYDLWLMRIEQYFLMTDYSLWEVIKNGNKVLRRTVGTVEQEYKATTAEEKHYRRNEMKSRAPSLAMKIGMASIMAIGMDISKITRKQSKTGKHEHGNQKSTKEAQDSKPKPRKVNYGQASVKESQTLVNKSQPLEDKNPNVSI
ncbi:hypothetical protein Tco_1315481 [Tanacetum coccineum]